MSESHQIFPSPFKNYHPVYFLKDGRNQWVLQERLYTTASGSAALSLHSSGMLR